MQDELDAKKLTSLLSPSGSLSKIVPSYEVREGQVQLLSSICKCIKSDLIGVFEAGTGIGKSFAYLIPCIEDAMQHGKRFVISTATINLQNQLINKDIPIVCNLLGIQQKDIKLALVKGRGNYICLRKLEDKIAETQFLQKDLGLVNLNEEKKELASLYEWANKSERGDREDLQEKVRDELWGEVASDGETCLGSLCPHISSCFVAKMRANAENALIIITNHHVLFADIKVKMDDATSSDSSFKNTQIEKTIDSKDEEQQNKRMPSVLPSFQHVVFDEAHSLKKIALSFFSDNISKKELKKYLALLYMQTARKKKSGIMVDLSYSMQELNIKEFEILHDRVLETYERLDVFALHLLITTTGVTSTNKAGYETDRINTNIFANRTSSHSFSSSIPLAIAITDIDDANRSEILILFDNFYKALYALVKDITRILGVLEEKEDLKEEKHKLGLLNRKMNSILNCVASFLNWKNQEDVVFWMEKRGKLDGDEVIFMRTPLNVASILKTQLFSKMKSAISVSATLKVGKTFGYFLNGIGLREENFQNIEKGYFESPFLYEDNVLLSVPSDLPAPTHPSFQDSINKAILALIKATEGRALVLFTSNQALKIAKEYVKDKIGDDIAIYAQGDDERFKLLQLFKNDIKSSLFATMSFWEGIDVPGEALSNLILAKLPFTVPNHPVAVARARSLEKRGFNPFLCQQVPEAAILFKQGFGRLIRSQQDRGVVTVLDNRLITKPYGKLFLDSIPKTKKCFATMDKIVKKIKEFM